LLQSSNDVPKFCILTVDVNPQAQAVARRMVELAGLSNYVTFILLPDTDTDTTTTATATVTRSNVLSDQLIQAVNARGLLSKPSSASFQIDFLLVDHAKECYLTDVQQLERTGLIRAGTAVAADNVVFFQLDDYRQHMQQRQAEGTVTTQLVHDRVYVEYSGDATSFQGDPELELLKDGMGT
jgi:catechol O-methyltransferase